MSNRKPEDGGDDYLRKLAQSVIEREQRSKLNAADDRQAILDRMPANTPVPTRTPIPQSTRKVSPPGASSDTVTRLTPPSSSAVAVPETTFRREIPVLSADGTYLSGTVLHFEDGSVGILKGTAKGKDYELVYILAGDGSLKPQGIHLSSYDTRPIGRLAPTYLAQVTTRLRWDRDLIVFHLIDFEDRLLIPNLSAPSVSGETPRPSSGAVPRITVQPAGAPAAPPSAPAPIPQSATMDALVRGRKVSIRFGKSGQAWEAIYWGRDELGTVFVHRTNDDWALMHLDLGRFKDAVTVGSVVEPEISREIEESLARQS